MVYPADDRLLRLRLLTREVKQLAASARAEVERCRAQREATEGFATPAGRGAPIRPRTAPLPPDGGPG